MLIQHFNSANCIQAYYSSLQTREKDKMRYSGLGIALKLRCNFSPFFSLCGLPLQRSISICTKDNIASIFIFNSQKNNLVFIGWKFTCELRVKLHEVVLAIEISTPLV